MQIRDYQISRHLLARDSEDIKIQISMIGFKRKFMNIHKNLKYKHSLTQQFSCSFFHDAQTYYTLHNTYILSTWKLFPTYLLLITSYVSLTCSNTAVFSHSFLEHTTCGPSVGARHISWNQVTVLWKLKEQLKVLPKERLMLSCGIPRCKTSPKRGARKRQAGEGIIFVNVSKWDMNPSSNNGHLM